MTPSSSIRWRHLLLACLTCASQSQSFVLKQILFFRHVSPLHDQHANDPDDDRTTVREIGEKLPPPPSSTGNPNDNAFRSFRETMPVSVQNWMRDSGLLRFLVDSLFVLNLPNFVHEYPQALLTFVKLTSLCKTVTYGHHPMQKMDILEPQGTGALRSKGLVVVCHGGAWGSGKPWMYRLTACKKLELGYIVAIWGYRTYPDASVDGQVSDLKCALVKLKELYPSLHTTLLGHSSGAHVALLGTLQEQLPTVDALVCLAGVYDIVKHYEYERGRGVEEISALKPAHGHVEDEWKIRSPTRLLDKTTSRLLPPTLLVHGAQDSIVPYTSATDFHSVLMQCDEANGENCSLSILPSTDHAETVIQLLMGGETQNVVLDWLEEVNTRRQRHAG